MRKNHNGRANTRKHMVMPEVETKTVRQQQDLKCAICGNAIDSIIDAISEPDGGYSHFDCVIDKIRREYRVKDPDVVSYIGQGKFGICSANEDGTFTIKEKINYESSDSFSAMKKFVEGSKE